MARVTRSLGPLFGRARMPIVVLRPTGELVAANDAAVAKYGYSLDELVGMRIHDLVADDRDVDADVALALHGQTGDLTRRPHRTRSGERLSVLPSAFPCEVDGEELLVSFLQDVTLLDAAEERARCAHEDAVELEARTRSLRAELLAAERLAAIGRLAAAVTHEVNNPAALVTVNLGVLRDRIAKGDTRTTEALSMLDDSVEAMGRIRDIVHDVKGFAVERGQERLDLSRLAAGAVRLVQLDGHAKTRLQAVFAPDVYARVRGSRLSQVLTNLLVNAAEALPRRGPAPASGGDTAAEPSITIRTFREGDLACVEVADTGPGVPPDLAERIFDPFFTTRAGSGGTGLGLWLARGIVEEEGGTINLSERPGGGAVFRIALPVAGPAPT